MDAYWWICCTGEGLAAAQFYGAPRRGTDRYLYFLGVHGRKNYRLGPVLARCSCSLDNNCKETSSLSLLQYYQMIRHRRSQDLFDWLERKGKRKVNLNKLQGRNKATQALGFFVVKSTEICKMTVFLGPLLIFPIFFPRRNQQRFIFCFSFFDGSTKK